MASSPKPFGKETMILAPNLGRFEKLSETVELIFPALLRPAERLTSAPKSLTPFEAGEPVEGKKLEAKSFKIPSI